ncbi:DUF951 domain-containing protein [Acholeplasma equifetale]|jgi:hypothetical protein|uniref:DUF951 domain-containing protein n=1 Tax=Acholeplasma equifetale TaxID=264634 RepID=UPI000A022C6F|nr:DUF951 domain-containing protein [Acholeplasma equifetale]
MMSFEVGQIVTTKKAHVCGSKEWVIKRIGADIKLQCKGCGREIVLMRYELEKRLIKK